MTHELKVPDGPWVVQKSNHGGGLLIKPVPGQVIAQLDEIPEMEACAHLFAASKELYAALALAVSVFKHSGIGAGSDAVWKMEAALAKARGES